MLGYLRGIPVCRRELDPCERGDALTVPPTARLDAVNASDVLLPGPTETVTYGLQLGSYQLEVITEHRQRAPNSRVVKGLHH